MGKINNIKRGEEMKSFLNNLNIIMKIVHIQKINNIFNNFDFILPEDVIYYLSSYLKVQDLCTLLKLNRGFNFIISKNHAWQHLLYKYNIVFSSLKENHKFLSYKFLIENKIKEKKLFEQIKRKQHNDDINFVCHNIYKYNLILKKIYENKEIKNLTEKNILYINKFMNKLSPLVKDNILSTDIYLETIKYHNSLIL